MAPATTAAGVLLVAGPVLGAIPVGHPALVRIWSGSRESYLTTIASHRRAWHLLNAGFAFATILTAAGLMVLALGAGPTTAQGAWLVAIAVAYALGGAPWIVFLGIRSTRDPILADMVAEGRETEPTESIVGAATAGMFASFIYTTALATLALSVTLWLGGGIAMPVVALAGALSALVLVIHLRTGDSIPAILYLPTLLVGVALLAGWT